MLVFFKDLLAFSFLQNALAAGILASVACGIVGSFVVVRRISYIAGAIAHCTLGGMGAAMYFNKECNITWISPMTGAFAAALLAAIIIAAAKQHGRQREDSVLGAVWSIGMAVGILFISQTGGYNENLMGYLFGDILMVSYNDLWIVACLDIILLIFTFTFFNKILASCFDEEFARLAGIKVNYYYYALLCMTALTVVSLVQVVGIIMVIALLTLPAAAASLWSKRFSGMILMAIFLCLISVIAGLVFSYQYNLPSGAVIIIFSAAIYLFSIMGTGLVK